MQQLRMTSGLLVVFSFLVFGFSSLSAGTWVIKPDGTGHAPTIQAGIDSAVAGDVVLLEPGTYTGVGNRDMNFYGKDITVTSSSGPSATIIDCQGLGRGFLFNSHELYNSILSGVTIQNGRATGAWGGAILCLSSHPEIEGNIFINNSTDQNGGAIGGDNSGPAMMNNQFRDNDAVDGGAIMMGNDSHGSILDNTFVNNSATGGGGAICNIASTLTISDNFLEGNSAAEGGGMYLDGGTPNVDHNVFYLNSATIAGGGIYAGDHVFLIFNNTLSENSAPSGGGMYITGPMNGPILLKNIIAFSSQGEGVACAGGASPKLQCNDIFGNAGGDALCGIDSGDNIFVDPQFCGLPMTGNLYLQSDSPCAEANNAACDLVGALPAMCGAVGTETKSWGEIKALYK